MPPELSLRRLGPADAGAVQDFVRRLSARTRTERYFALGECAGGEFALVVADGWQGLGLGEALLERLLAHAEHHRLPALHGLVRERNRPMLRLARRLGFRAAPAEDPGFMRIEFGL